MTNEQWFQAFDEHLLSDAAPSKYFMTLEQNDAFPKQHPFSALLKLKSVAQNPKHHPEGDVWIHTMLVVDNAAKQRSQSKDIKVLMWAALLHDLGKIPATKVRRGRITAYDHDKMGRGMAQEFLVACGCDTSFSVQVAAMVRWHMQSLFVLKDLPYAELGAMTQQVDIDEIALLTYADRLGRGEVSEKQVKAEQENINIFVRKSREYAQRKKKSGE